MGLLTRVEEIISIPFEFFHNRKEFHPVDLNRLAVRCMEKGSRKGINKSYAPNRFKLLLNPEDYRELHPFLGTIRSEIGEELRRFAKERRYLLAGDLTVEIVEDKLVPVGLPQVRGYMHGGKDPESTIRMSHNDNCHRESKNAPSRDCETVILLPENRSRSANKAREVVPSTCEDRVEEVYMGYAKKQDGLTPRPQSQPSLAIIAALVSRAVAGKEHLPGSTMSGGMRAAIEPCFLLPNRDRTRKSPTARPVEVVGRLETNRDGVSLHIGNDGVYLENRNADPKVLVNDEVLSGVVLNDGDYIRIGDFEMTYHSGNGGGKHK